MRYYLKNIYPCKEMCHMMTMSSDIELNSYDGPGEEEEDDNEMPVERKQRTGTDQKFYRALGFSFSANDVFSRDKKRLITSHSKFASELLRLVPDQVHFGPLQLYDAWRKETVCQQEIVIDIDVTDYTDYCGACGQRHTSYVGVETTGANSAENKCNTGQRHYYYCDCKGAGKACSVCWFHIEGAATLLHFLLVHQLGIPERHLLWVLSGKKGIHCLVNDPRYVRMTTQQRTLLFQFLKRDTMGKLKEFGRVLTCGSGSNIAQQWEEQFVENVVCRRHMLQNEVFLKDCLDIVRLHYNSLHHQLEQRWIGSGGKGTSSLNKWQTLKTLEYGQFGNQCPPSLLLVLHFYYPRIDKGPLCTKNHLIKAPFSVHRSTQNIALPVERTHIVERHGLPTLSLTLDDCVRHYKRMGKERHPDYEAGCVLLEQWLASARATPL